MPTASNTTGPFQAELDPESVVLFILSETVPVIRLHTGNLRDFNNLPNIPWRLREQMRTLQGMLDKFDDYALEVIDGLRTPEKHRVIEQVWPS